MDAQPAPPREHSLARLARDRDRRSDRRVGPRRVRRPVRDHPHGRLRRPFLASAGATLPAGARSSVEEQRTSNPRVGGSNPPGRALREAGLIRRMQFDRHTLVLLVRRPDAPELTDEEAAELQDLHLAYRADLRDRGYLIGGGPLVDQDDERLRGISIMLC